ncbi:MAG: hypothetical protein HKN03_09930 [Acidimicrobiales bacterium]|nr:hypothetical protein [Acidimicrobiales bacterium]
MVIPSWAPPPTPEAPESTVPGQSFPGSTRRTAIGAAVAMGALVAATAFYFLVVYPAEPSPPETAVDLLLSDLADQRWNAASERFGTQCSDVSPEVLRLQFEPVMKNYENHQILPVSNLDPGDDGFVRVLGSMKTTVGDTNSVRADVAPSVDAEGNVQWSVCGMQIYGP